MIKHRYDHSRSLQRAAERRQNLAQGEASAASETLGYSPRINQARFSGRQGYGTACGSTRVRQMSWLPARYRERFCTFLLLLLLSIAIGCNRNNGGGISSGTGGWPSSLSTPAQVSSSAQIVKVSASSVEIVQGGSADAIITLTISPGYHINANPASFPYLIPTEVMPAGADGITAGAPIYPTSQKRKFQFAEETLAVYEGDAQIKMSLRADSNAPGGARSFLITARVQACDNEKCYPPANIDATIPIEVK